MVGPGVGRMLSNNVVDGKAHEFHMEEMRKKAEAAVAEEY